MIAESRDQCAIAKNIQFSRIATSPSDEVPQRGAGEHGFVRPPRDFRQSMKDVRNAVGAIEWPYRRPDCNSLPKLSQVLLLQFAFELRLSHEDDLYQLVFRGFQVGQEPQPFQSRNGHPLRFVDSDNYVTSLAILADQPFLQRAKLIRRRAPEVLRQDFVDDLLERGERIQKADCRGFRAIQPLEKGSQHDRLARSDLTDNRHESLALGAAVHHRRECLAMGRA